MVVARTALFERCRCGRPQCFYDDPRPPASVLRLRARRFAGVLAALGARGLGDTPTTTSGVWWSARERDIVVARCRGAGAITSASPDHDQEDPMNFDNDSVDGYAVPVDPMDLLQCDSCQ